MDNEAPPPLDQLTNLRHQTEKNAKEQTLYRKRSDQWIDWEDVQRTRIAVTKAYNQAAAAAKANILRDFLEDFVEGRSFWPQSEWKRFASERACGGASSRARRARGPGAQVDAALRPLWAAMQARTSTIDFDFAGYAAKRLAEFRRLFRRRRESDGRRRPPGTTDDDDADVFGPH